VNSWLQSLLTVMLGSGAAFAVIQLFLDYRRDYRKRTDSLQYLALRLAFIFEGYAISCAEKESDHSTAVEHDGHAGRLLGSVPDAPTLPESDAYEFLDSDILSDAFDLPQRVMMADRFASFWWDTVGDRDSFYTEVGHQTLQMGAMAMEVAGKIRRRYRLPARPLVIGTWDIGAYLKDEVRKIAEAKAKVEVPDVDLS
jgi:hypothetical protein